ncbi:DUF3043 domain-containing protein [Jiangella alkaliphila]|uniref:DUF3043 domain-containing protein n=1 Tax=Jiangella alkaliphila TaxID=419479 RepID=A0A1H2K9F8_9ACTN|nr:DUF3043 domain-containing protein [Jiangella alkaliphila]SDU65360.1 Protein of unknown function [Jiangella alkaliphila]
MFRRRTTPETADVPAEGAADDDLRPARKGRPTPKRSEAEKARKQRVRPALNRREAMRRDRERMREERARTRQAMNTGDEKHYLGRDQGEVRRFVRNYVDSRRTVAEFFLPLILVILLTSLIGVPVVQLASTIIWLGVMVLLIVDLTILGVRVKREVRKRFPDDPGKGHVLYAITRTTQLRRLRLPKPQVKPGTLV